jgi:hypothetical protein
VKKSAKSKNKMLPDYDFLKGVRGKYAEQASRSKRPDLTRKPSPKMTLAQIKKAVKKLPREQFWELGEKFIKNQRPMDQREASFP